ncbi:hypothetical protein SAMN05880501_105176 [Ureibacillus xyleni]|uniref:Nucleotide exchange factor GrpE n=1 Tax=Ureibacillus xyleni TaxID=614648 RepID=A0A285SM08_9BACL|nr:hypothetical protein [Ureibacillus xyleni]SOC09081.1 hypothetical protein SAMN05880501_105176 [Ureibacillus xyleni]
MQYSEWQEQLVETVQACRLKAQEEYKKRLNRIQTAQPVQNVSVKLTFNDYIKNFVVNSSSVYSGDYNMIEGFINEWKALVQSLQLEQQPVHVQQAIAIMTGDIERVVENIASLSPNDEEFTRKVMKQLDVFISYVIVSIRDGWSTNPELYSKLLTITNDFLSQMGVHTIPLQLGEKINYETTEPVVSTSNITDDAEADETIKEIQLYPYVFGKEEIPFIFGKVIAWKKG